MTEKEYLQQKNDLIKKSTQKEILFNIGSLLANINETLKEIKNGNNKKS